VGDFNEPSTTYSIERACFSQINFCHRERPKLQELAICCRTSGYQKKFHRQPTAAVNPIFKKTFFINFYAEKKFKSSSEWNFNKEPSDVNAI